MSWNLITDSIPSLLSWITSTALVAIAIFIFNENKERKRLRVCCRILLSEVSRHALWLKLLLDKNIDILDLIINSDVVNSDWSKLKYEPVFARIPFEEFEIILDHYREIRALQEVAKKSVEQGLSFINEKLINDKLVGCYKTYDILHKFSNPTTYPKRDKNK